MSNNERADSATPPENTEDPEIPSWDQRSQLPSPEPWSQILSSERWSQIQIEGGLKPVFKQEIVEAIERYKQRRTATKPMRDKVEQVRAAIFKAVMLLDRLSDNDEFLYIGVQDDGEGAPNMDVFAAWVDASVKVYEEMDKANERFDSGPRTLISPVYYGALEELVFDVLLIQARSQEKPPPTYYKNSSRNPRFEKFVYLCAQAADSELEADYPRTRNDKIERALKRATEVLKQFE